MELTRGTALAVCYDDWANVKQAAALELPQLEQVSLVLGGVGPRELQMDTSQHDVLGQGVFRIILRAFDEVLLRVV